MNWPVNFESGAKKVKLTLPKTEVSQESSEASPWTQSARDRAYTHMMFSRIVMNTIKVVLPKRGTLYLEISRRGGLVAQGVGAFIVAGETHAFSAKYDNTFVVADLPVDHTMTPRHVFERFQMSPFFAIGPEAQGLIDYLAERLVRGAVPFDALAARRAQC
jgi:hypothetical protein